MAAPASVAFDGHFWVFHEKKSALSFARWEKQPAKLYASALSFAPGDAVHALLVLNRQHWVVARALVPPSSPTSVMQRRLKLLLQVRPLEDVRKSYVYHTAATIQTLEIYVDDEHARAQIVRFVNATAQGRHYPDQAPSDSKLQHDPLPQTQAPRTSALDDAFDALARAQALADRCATADAVLTYQAAESGFAAAEAVVADERSRRLLRERRQDIRAVVAVLQGKTTVIAVAPRGNSTEVSGLAPAPATALAATPASTVPGPPPAAHASALQTALPPAPLSPISAAKAALLPTVSSSDTLSPTAALRSRLGQLNTFSDQLALHQAQSEHKPDGDVLRLRLQALKNEKATPPTMNDLTARLQRLRSSSNDAVDTAAPAPIALNTTANAVPKNAIDAIIQQARDELALGIVDGLEPSDDSSDDDLSII